jgi:DNA primase
MRVDTLLESLDIKYLPKGEDYLVKCINPDHDDAKPSMRINKVTGIYHCFSCGHKGNLLREYGYAPSVLDNMSRKIKKKISNLLVGGLTIPEGAMSFKHDHRNISVKTYKKFGAFTHTDYEGRVVFPITTRQDNIVAFLGRYIHSDASPKYKVFPDHTPLPLFPPRPELIKGSIILVEGMYDMLNLYQHGLTNTVVAFGTSTLYKNIVDKLAPYELLGVNKVYIMFDGDKPGQDAAKKLKKIIPERLNPEIIQLPEDLDPGDLDKAQIEYIKSEIYK